MMDMTNRQSNTISLDYKYFLSLLINSDKFFKAGTLQSDKSPIIFGKFGYKEKKGNFLFAWAGQFAGIKYQTMHRFEQYLKILQLYHENSRFPPSFKFEA
jgi:hypothetical protein